MASKQPPTTKYLDGGICMGLAPLSGEALINYSRTDIPHLIADGLILSCLSFDFFG